MIDRVEIRNFRCFKKLSLQGLKRFNFIVGESGTGKTAFLEALFLVCAGNPEIWFRLRRWRGLGEGPMHLNVRATYEALFRDLFYAFDQESGADITIFDSDQGKRGLEIYYENNDEYTLPLEGEKKGADTEAEAFTINPIQFKWNFSHGVVRSEVVLKDGALRMTGNAKIYPLFLVSPRTFSGRDQAQFFSNLSRTKKAGPILDAMREIFPAIQDISLELIAGEPQIHVALADLAEKLPLGDLSGGISKYIEIILGIVSNPGGAILVDEFENGFYYQNMPALLKNIVSLCDAHRVQLFATTHSYEFLTVMSQAMGSAAKGAEAFSLLRLQKKGSAPPEIRQISGDSYQAAIEKDFEVR